MSGKVAMTREYQRGHIAGWKEAADFAEIAANNYLDGVSDGAKEVAKVIRIAASKLEQPSEQPSEQEQSVRTEGN